VRTKEQKEEMNQILYAISSDPTEVTFVGGVIEGEHCTACGTCFDVPLAVQGQESHKLTRAQEAHKLTGCWKDETKKAEYKPCKFRKTECFRTWFEKKGSKKEADEDQTKEAADNAKQKANDDQKKQTADDNDDRKKQTADDNQKEVDDNNWKKKEVYNDRLLCRVRSPTN